jgi:hypothetical protein
VPRLAAIAVALIAVALAVTHGAMGTGAQDGVCTPPLARKLQGVANAPFIAKINQLAADTRADNSSRTKGPGQLPGGPTKQ